MTYKKSDFTVGQKLFYVGRNNAQSKQEITISGVGKKWLTIDNHLRLDIETLIADGGDYTPPGAAYLSEQDYLDLLALQGAWLHFKSLLSSHRVPEDVTIEKINQAKAILGLGV